MKRRIVLQDHGRSTGDKMLFSVLEQTHHCTDFPHERQVDNEWNAKNNVILCSVTCPEVRGREKRYNTRSVGTNHFIVFLQGDDTTRHDMKIECTYDEYDMILKAVDEYNRVGDPVFVFPQELFEI